MSTSTIDTSIKIIHEYISDTHDEYTEYLSYLLGLYRRKDQMDEKFLKEVEREIISQGSFVADNTEIVKEVIIPAREQVIQNVRRWKDE